MNLYKYYNSFKKEIVITIKLNKWIKKKNTIYFINKKAKRKNKLTTNFKL